MPGPSRLQIPESRRLRRDTRRLVEDRDGNPIVVDTTAQIEANRREMRELLRLQAERKVPRETRISLRKIVQSDHDQKQHPPVTWSRVFGDKMGWEKDLRNPFAQDDDHVRPPTHPEPNGDVDEDGPDSETNPHVQDDQP